jgi:hypothetical protein
MRGKRREGGRQWDGEIMVSEGAGDGGGQEMGMRGGCG